MQHDAAETVAYKVHAIRVDAADELRELREHGLDRTTDGAIGEAVALEAVARGKSTAQERGLRAREPQAMYEYGRGFHGAAAVISGRGRGRPYTDMELAQLLLRHFRRRVRERAR